MKMNKKKARNHTTGEQINSVMDDVKSGYKDAEEKTLEAVSSAKDSVVTWVEEGVSNIKEGTHHLMDDAKETYDKTAKSIDKNVKHGLRQYNVKAQEFADKVPGGLGDTVIRYPWVAITVSLLIGIALGFLLKPSRRA
jgi:ElaB/YqjD/DUF883 family membrane-anchored ribosome-binding protein